MDNLLREKVESFISSDVLPYLSSHNGGIKIRSIEDKIVTITLLGSCSKCPLSQITFEEVVREKLINEFPDEIEDVRLYNEISDDLWNFAKQFLREDKENGCKEIL